MFSNHMKTNIMCMATSENLYIDMWSWFGRRGQRKFSIVMGHCELDWNVFKPRIMKGQTTMNKLYMRWVCGGLSRFSIKLKNHIQKLFGHVKMVNIIITIPEINHLQKKVWEPRIS